MGMTARATGRAWRLLWWFLFPPAGALMSWRAGVRRRHRQQLTAIVSLERTTAATARDRNGQGPRGGYRRTPPSVTYVPWTP